MEGPTRRGRKAAARPRSTTALDRRRFLILMGGATAYAALRPTLAFARRPGAVSVLQSSSLPAELPANSADAARVLIGAAVLAPSDWNAQPWRFEVEDHTIRVVADSKRALPVTDPDRRGMMVSLGAALENLLIASRAYGLRPAVRYFPQGAGSPVVAEVTTARGELRRDLAMFEMIPRRRTNRREYDGRGLFPENRVQLLSQATDEANIRWLDGRDRLRSLSTLVHDATRAQMSEPRAQAEQYSWLRFDGDEKRRGDGVPVSALEVGPVAELFASRYFKPGSFFLRFGMDAAANQARDQVRSCGAVALITTPRRDESQWIAGGQTFERFCLKATQLGIAHQAMSAPIEIASFRSDVLAAFGAAGEEPIALLRLGHAKRVDPTPRRNGTLVSTFRNA